MRREVYPITIAHGPAYVRVVPFHFRIALVVGAAGGDAGDVSRLMDLVGRVEEEVSRIANAGRNRL